MKKYWNNPEVENLKINDTLTSMREICTNSICVSKCDVCGGCTGSKTKISNCSYFESKNIKVCEHIEVGGCKLPQS